MRVKRLTALLLALLTLVTLAACKPSPSASTDPAASPSPSKAADPSPSVEDIPVVETPDPFSAYNEPVKITIAKAIESTNTFPDGQSATDNNYTRYIKDQLNIDIEFEWVAQDGDPFDQQIGLAIMSDTLPDMVVVKKAPQFLAMVKNGLCQDIGQVIQDYASPAMQKIFDSTGGKAISNVTFDGKVLALPNVAPGDDDYHNMWIRKDWLDNVGLQPPKTLDDVEAVLSAFITKDPNKNSKKDTIGLAGPDKSSLMYATFLEPASNHFGFDPVFQAYKAYPGYWINDGGKAVYGSTQPQVKDALAKLRDWYGKGLIDPEIGVRENKVEPVVGGQSGFFFGVWWAGYWPLPDAQANDPTASWMAYPGPFSADGSWNPHVGSSTREYGIINASYDHPEALLKINNILLRDESKLDTAAVQIGDWPLRLVYAPMDESTYSAQAVLDVLTGKKAAADIDTLGYKLLDNDLATCAAVKLAPFDNFDIQYWNTADSNFNRMYSLLVGCNPQMTTKFNPVSSITYAQTESMEKYWATLFAMEKEVFLGIITGSRPLDDFDKFVTDWKAQGGDTITGEVGALIK